MLIDRVKIGRNPTHPTDLFRDHGDIALIRVLVQVLVPIQTCKPKIGPCQQNQNQQKSLPAGPAQVPRARVRGAFR